MSKLAVLVVCLLVLSAALASGVSADIAAITIYPGENWVSLPLVPFDPAPTHVFQGLGTDYAITRYDAPAQTEVAYAENPNLFGNLLLGDGYIISNPGSTTFVASYDGVPDGVPDGNGTMTDMWIALLGGMNWIGQPFNHSTPFASIRVTDGTTTLAIAEAVNQGWLDGVWNTWNGAAQSPLTVGLAGYNPTDAFLRPGKMYKVNTYRDNIALMIPAYAVPEPSGLAALLCGLGALGGMLRRRIRS